MFEIIGQLLGIIAVILGFVSFQMKTPRGIFFRDKCGKKGLVAPIIFTILTIVTIIMTWDGWYSAFFMSGLVVNTIGLALPSHTRQDGVCLSNHHYVLYIISTFLLVAA